jgi:hypothetical protein
MTTKNICKGLTFNECELVILRQSVDNAKFKTNQEELKSPEIKIIFDILEEFIKRKKLILYGGTAINNILPKRDQFYDKRYILPDYDMYSYNAINDSKELVDLYNFHGFNECEAKSGVHDGTYKVYVNFIPIADITQISKPLFDAIKRDSIKVDEMLHSPPNLLRMSMYLELSRPFGDVSRWEKVLKRLILLNKHYPLKAKKCKNIYFERNLKMSKAEEKKIYNILKNIFIDEKVIFFGSYALSKYSKYMSNKLTKKTQTKPDFDVLSENPLQVTDRIKKKLNENDINNCSIVRHNKIGEIIPEHYEIKIGNDSVAFIYKPIACHSYNTIKNGKITLKIATIDTMLSFYLAFIYVNSEYYDTNRILCMSKYLFEVQAKNRLAQKGVLKRFSTNCYGHQKTLKEIFSEKSEKFKKIKKNSKEYEKYFLRYNLNKNNDENNNNCSQRSRKEKNKIKKTRKIFNKKITRKNKNITTNINKNKNKNKNTKKNIISFNI